MFLIIEFSFIVFRCQIKAQTISEHCVFQKCSRSKKSLKIEKMVPKLKKSPKIGESCLKLVKFMVFTQKIPQKIGFVKSEKFHLELAWYVVPGNCCIPGLVFLDWQDWYSWHGQTLDKVTSVWKGATKKSWHRNNYSTVVLWYQRKRRFDEWWKICWSW